MNDKIKPLASPEEQICLFGHPSHAELFPASSLWVPGQWSGAFSGTFSPGILYLFKITQLIEIKFIYFIYFDRFKCQK